MSFIWKDDFFDDDFLSNGAIFSSVVQAYTQPYSFGGRVKLIICQIRHEVGVSIHEKREKKTLDGGPYKRDFLLFFWTKNSNEDLKKEIDKQWAHKKLN